MTENGGVLRMQPSGRWAVCRPSQEPIEITSGEPFRSRWTALRTAVARMEYRRLRGGGGEYFSVDD